MAWFESWFNSSYYHILYSDRDEKEAEAFLKRLIMFLAPSPDARMLDLACGKGRHSIFLNSLGFEVTGIDLSKESIDYCSKFENNSLSFFVHDMRKLFRTNDFDYVLNLFTSLGYFERETENKVAIQNACIALRPGGRMIIDFFNSEFVRQNLVIDETKVRKDITFKISKDITGTTLFKHIRFEDNNRQYHFTEKVTLLTYSDFENYLLSFGMEIETVFGDYALHPFETGSSPRLIIIAKKPL